MRHPSTFAVLCLLTGACAPAPEQDVTPMDPSGSLDAEPAGYLSALTPQDVEDIADRYELPLDEVERFVAAPFACAPYGDLCALVGAEQAEALIVEVIDLMVVGGTPDEIQATIEEDAAVAQQAWDAHLATVGAPFYGTPSRTSTRSYRNAAGFSCRIKVQASVINWGVRVEQKAQLNNECISSLNLWVPSLMSSGRVCLDSRRVLSGGGTSTQYGCSSVSSWDSVSRSHWFDRDLFLGLGTNTATATGSTTGVASTSATATWW